MISDVASAKAVGDDDESHMTERAGKEEEEEERRRRQEELLRDKYSYGFRRLRVPESLQSKLNNGAWFLLLVSLVNAFSGAVTNGLLKVSVTSLERNFKLSSYDSGMIISMYDIAACLSILPVSYFGGRGNKPRWVGVGVLIQGVGIFIFSLAHFMAPSYSYVPDGMEGLELSMCDGVDKRMLQNERCLADAQESASIGSFAGASAAPHRSMKHLFMFAQILNGVGATPLSVLAITFMDENVGRKFYSFCIAAYFLSTLIGPALGFLVGSFSLTYFVDLAVDPTDITSESRSWVGAWWIGFAIVGPLLIAIALPILAFPAKLPARVQREWLEKANSPVELQREASSTSIKSVTTLISNWQLWQVVSNWSFMLLSVSAALLSSIVAGFLSFGPKYAESAFRKSASEAATLYGFVCVPAAAIGLITGAAMMSFPRTTSSAAIKVCLVVSFFTVFTHFGLLLDCGDELLPPANEAALAACVDRCECSDHYRPVCGSDGLMYFSPCHAGCNGTETFVDPAGGQVSIYTKCTCMGDNSTIVENWPYNITGAREGRCGSDVNCPYQSFILFTMFFMILGMFFCIIPGIELSLSCFPVQMRSLALGVQWVLIRTIGTIPGPVIFGLLFDKSCEVKTRDCPQDAETCAVYSNSLLSSYLFTVPIIFKILSVFPFVVLCFIYKGANQKHAEDVEELQEVSASVTHNRNDAADGEIVVRMKTTTTKDDGENESAKMIADSSLA